MKAFTIDRYAKRETGRIAGMPQPELLDDDLLIQIHAARANALDSKIETASSN